MSAYIKLNGMNCAGDDITEELANYDFSVMKTYSARKFSNHVKKLLPNVENPTDYQIVEALYKLYGEKSAVGTYQRYDRLAAKGLLIPQPF